MTAFEEPRQTFSLACIVCRQTENACLIEDPASGDKHWIPFSQVEEIHWDKGQGPLGSAVVVMTEWIARQKGLK